MYNACVFCVKNWSIAIPKFKTTNKIIVADLIPRTVKLEDALTSYYFSMIRSAQSGLT